jgi:hypothetical protein
MQPKMDSEHGFGETEIDQRIANGGFQPAVLVRRRNRSPQAEPFKGFGVTVISPVALIQEPVPFGTVHRSTIVARPKSATVSSATWILSFFPRLGPEFTNWLPPRVRILCALCATEDRLLRRDYTRLK